jgi:hypothetical protein
MHEDGIGMARAFETELLGAVDDPIGVRPGFFAWVDGAPAEGYRAPRLPPGQTAGATPPLRPISTRGTMGIITGEYGARVLTPLLQRMGRDDVRVVAVRNEFFGGNIAVTGLLVGTDIARTLASEPADCRYLLPDVCLSNGVFLDGSNPTDLPRPVEIVATDGVALRRALER